MSSLPATGGKVSKDDLVRAIKEATAQQQLKLFLGRMHELCFEKCIPAPGSSMSRTDEACVSNCVRKYMNLHDSVSREWNSNIQKMQGGGQL